MEGTVGGEKWQQNGRRSGSGSVSVSGSKGSRISFGHERLDVYRAMIEYVGAYTAGIDPDTDTDPDTERRT